MAREKHVEDERTREEDVPKGICNVKYAELFRREECRHEIQDCEIRQRSRNQESQQHTCSPENRVFVAKGKKIQDTTASHPDSITIRSRRQFVEAHFRHVD